MNRKHLSAFIWLRWRILVNQAKRTGTVSTVITAIVGALGLVASVSLFVCGVVLGAVGMPHIPDVGRLAIWVGIIVLFLFFWLIGLLTALQRSEALSIEKLLHLPVSPSGAFVVNYISSSIMSVTLILFVPGMTGLAIGEVSSTGSVMLLAFPLLAAFVFACTALTYQFQGWLASLMSNPRRRRTVIVLLTIGIVLLVQVPNLLNILRPWDKVKFVPREINDPAQMQLQEKLKSGEITIQQFGQQQILLKKMELDNKTANEQTKWEQFGRTTRLICGLLPPGWVVLGMTDLADGHVLMALLGTLGLGLIGMFSLMRAYQTTLRIYTQGGSGESGKASRVMAASNDDPRPRLMEWKLPFVSEYAASVAVAGFRSLLRAPEAKMLLLSPLIMLFVLGGGIVTSANYAKAGPFVVYGVMAMLLISMIQFVGNMFGFDRDGFRVFVLSPIPRREILLGKNLATAPLILVLGFIVVTGVGLFTRLRWDQFLAAYFQFLTMYLFFSLLGNLCSILTPYLVPSGSLKGARPKLTIVLTQLAVMSISPCVVGLPAILPTIVEASLAEFGVVKDLPVSLGLSVLIFLASLWCYRRILNWEGRLLAEREQRILDAVTKRDE